VAVDRSTGAGSVVVVAVVVVVVVVVVGATVVVVDVVVVGGTVVVVVVLLVVEDEAVVVAGSVVVLYDMSVVDDSTTSVEVTSGRSADWAELAHDALTITTPITIPTRTTAVLDRLDGSICQPAQPELPVQPAVP
jgi:transcriptional regulator of nitric oxide reductase